MPPSAVKTIRDEIFWQYAKIISESAKFGKKNFGFIMSKFKELQTGKIKWSTSVREWVKEHENPDECIYCGSHADLTVEHILPRSKGGPDTPDNVVKICRNCNSSKGGKRLYEWRGLKYKDEHHRIVEGKYLKLLFSLHEQKGTLNSNPPKLCKICNMGQKCPEKEKLTVFCLEGMFKGS